MSETKKDLLAGVRVLVVDNEADACDLFTYMLTTHGASVTAAPSAATALEMLRVECFDVLTIDGGMPEQSGWSLIESIRQMPPEQGGLTPAAAITSFAYPEDVQRSLASGFQVHLSKPVSLELLVATIAKLVGRDGSGMAEG